MSKKSILRTHEFYNWDIEDEGRKIIHEWSRSRIQKMKGLNKSYYGYLVYTFHWETLRSFVENFNFMVILQMIFAGIAVFIFDHYEIHYNFNTALFVSPIVFPLAFSINTDFQRREKVLDDLANFKSSSMLFFFCMREWKKGAGLSDAWMNQIQRKLHSIMFNLREYLLTSRKDRRSVIARYMYEDFSDCSQLIDNLRNSKKLTSNPALISRAYHLLNALCLSFERLCVIRDYRSPRSIRSFNKVLVLFLPIILCPYFVAMARENGAIYWGPYVIAVLVAAVFGALQGVQDKLDDPFDGMSEDDINLDTIDEWTFNSLQSAVNRDFTGLENKLYDDDESKFETEKQSLLPNKNKRTNFEQGQQDGSSKNSIAQIPKSFGSQSISELIQQMKIKDSNKKKRNPFRRICAKIENNKQYGLYSDSDSKTVSNVDGTLPVININSTDSCDCHKNLFNSGAYIKEDTRSSATTSNESCMADIEKLNSQNKKSRQTDEQQLLPPDAQNNIENEQNHSCDKFEVVIK